MQYDYTWQFLWAVARRTLGMIAYLFLSMRTGISEGEVGYVELHTGYGTPERIIVHGRVLLDQPPAQTALPSSRIGNVIRTICLLETDELSHREVTVHCAGRSATAHTSRKGAFTVELERGPRPFPPGHVEIHVRSHIKGKIYREARGEAIVYPQSIRRVVICDFDDTVAKTDMKHQIHAAWTMLTGDPTRIQPVEGMWALLSALARSGAGDPAIFYLSGRPTNFYPRIRGFLSSHCFPTGPVLLRNLGLGPGNDPWSLLRYKLRHIRNLLALFPDSEFILIGDSGQEDPEIFRSLSDRMPQRIRAILVRRIEETPSSRFDGMLTFCNGFDGLKRARQTELI